MVSRILKGAAVLVGAISLAGVASAGHNGSSSLPTLGSWTSNSGTTYSYSSASTATTTMSPIHADATYGTGSISSSYTLDNGYDGYGVQGFSGQLTGLGYNESLQMTNCPTTVHGAAHGARVLGCYNVVKPVPQTNYVRVVRPIIYVRYPVPVPVPVTSPCGVVTHYSRYGGSGPQGGWGAHHGYRHGGYKHGGCR